MSYSQNDEEQHILSALGNDPGMLIDIGAYDGKTFSNSLALIEAGWEALLVEPSVSAFFATLNRHKDNGKVKCLNALVGCKRGIAQFFPSHDAVSTSDLAHYELWKTTATFLDPYFVPQITVEDIFDTFSRLKKAKFVSIDTEGTSSFLFFDWPFALCRPKVFCVEYDKERDRILDYATKRGYALVYESSENLVVSDAQ